MRRAGPDDYEKIKAICNDPQIRRHLSDPYTEVDPGRWLAEPRNVVLFHDDNAMLFLWRWIGIYEVHILFTCKGREAGDLTRPMLGTMFGAGASMLLAVIPKNLRHVRLFARSFGFRLKGEIQTIEGLSEMYQLETEQWDS